MQVALNGPPLEEACAAGGVVDQALRYFFSIQNRNLRVPDRYTMTKKERGELDALTWNISVPHPEVVSQQRPQEDKDNDGDLDPEDLAQFWPEDEEELKRLDISVPEDEKTAMEVDQDTSQLLRELNSANLSRHSKKRKSSNNPDHENSIEENSRAVRTRTGRVRKEVSRLSFNHKDPNSVAMLFYSNN